MSRLCTIGAEMQSLTTGVEFSQAAVGGAAVTIDTNTKHSGAASYKFVSSDAASRYIGHLYSASNVVTYARIYVNFASFPTDADGAILQINNTADTTTQASISIDTNGTLRLFDGNIAGTQRGSASSALSLDTWYMVELKVENGATPEIEGRLNGTSFASGAMTATDNGGMLYFGHIDWVANSTMYIDDISVNDNAGDADSGYPGEEMLVLALPTGAGDAAATTGIYSYINEIPPSDTATTGSTMIELDTNTSSCYYDMTDSTTLGIPTDARIRFVFPVARVREETSGTSNYRFQIISKSGGTRAVPTGGLVDCGDTTPRTNPVGTTAFAHNFYCYYMPSAGLQKRWTATGTDSVDNMQIGVETTDGNPDTWVLWLGAYVSYVPAKIDQTEAAFYDDGTENGSTLLSAGANSITRDVTSNSNIQLRIRLQEKNVSGTDSTDDWKLQYSLNGGTYTDIGGAEVIGYNSASLTDTNATTNRLGNGTVLSYVSQAAAQSTSVTMPTHQAGDLIVAWAFRDGSTTAPTTPDGWTKIQSNSGTLCSWNAGYKIATSSTELSGTWSSASALVVQVYRGQRGTASTEIVLNSAGSTGSATSSVVYETVGTMVEAGTSWVLGFAGHTSVDTSLETAPTGMTARSNAVGATCEVAGHDTNAAVSSFDQATVEVGGTAGNYITRTFELKSSIFTAGKISEDGLVDNHSLPAGSWTEHLYSLTLVSSALDNDDTLDFRVLRNGVALDAYTVTPRITVNKSELPPSSGNFFLVF